MKTLSLAMRNLLRNRRRSLMTLSAMVLGLAAVLLFGGYIRDLTYGLQTDFVNRSGHLQIQHKGYFLYGSGNPAAFGIRDYETVLATVKRDPVLAPMLVVATPTLEFGGIAGNFAAGVSRTVFASGTVVEEQSRMLDWNDYGMREIRKPLTLVGTEPDAAVIGTGVARVLQLCAALNVSDCAPQESAPLASAKDGVGLPDDIAALSSTATPKASTTTGASRTRIEILAASARGAPNVAAVNVVQAEFQGSKELDDVFVALHLAQAQKLVFGNGPPQVTAIALQLQRTAQMPQAVARLGALLASTLKDRRLEVLDYEVLNPFYGQTRSMFAAIFGFMAVLIGSVVLFTISNTMSMTVVERTVEIGTVRALGLRRRGIQQMFLTEAILLGVAASLLGVLAALLGAWLINLLNLTWIPPGRVEAVPLTVRVAGEYGMMLAGAAGLIVVASVSALLPATRASRMNIVDALRHV